MKIKKLSISHIIPYILSFFFILWIFASWMNIITNNLHPDPQYYPWNFFVLFTEFFKLI